MFKIPYLHPQIKALIVTSVFAFAGILGWYFAESTSPDPLLLLPLAIFYATLTVNTYFSVKLFASITPLHDYIHQLFDLLMVAAYFVLAYTFFSPQAFFLAALFLFIFALLKYILLLGVIPHLQLLKRKIIIDLFGTLLCASVVAGAYLGYVTESAWVLATLFLLANIYLLLINHMYRLID